ncbi:MAG: Ribosome-recycling factor [Candidatus Uhrbacteria bacterium GW2011_GWD2_52_7]|uniref:Ribosome-recycling factor n=1 Tax=Candidatus Uhrbacteria bacterium GW2011_GWD2_52_7 TaxID=1618989 RepID=A0A0G1ZNC9_9BACT|nr:MAG: Ribosome-recycling factor [Candidatus Uhrbacteria bacterium GW2011_GWD2_52_7]
MALLDEFKPQFTKVHEHLVKELAGIRTGRATPALVEDIQVEAYGAFQPIKALASMGTPDARTLLIEPWDGSAVKAIETALQKSDIGIMPTVDGKAIRLVMPMMTEENRQRMVKVMKEKLEDARVSARKVREEARKAIDKLEGVGEDEVRRLQADLDKMVKDFNAKIDETGDKKEKEITTI